MIFKKELMLNRLEKEGLLDYVDIETLEILSKLDGHKVNTNTWNNIVKDEEPRYSIMLNGTTYPINSNDCE